jgi:hypothetical protein
MRSRSWHIRTKEWFPPEDEVAALMAQLCVLREDLYLELQGIKEDKIEPLDDNGSNYRDIYFFRNSTRTLFEINKTVQCLKRKPVFMKALAKQKDFHNIFGEFDKAINKARNLLKRLRHETAGHLDQAAFQNALTKIAPDTKSLFQASEHPKRLHYRFALEFLGAIFLSGVVQEYDAKTKELYEKEWRMILETISGVSFKAINAIDTLFGAYVEQRGLMH